MGASLIFLGLFLLFSRLLGLQLSHAMMSWWPIILVVLGVEILIYLFFNGKEKPFLKYDFLSIFFVGILGTVGIGFAILSTIGFLEKAEELISTEERSMNLPDFSYSLNSEIKRVVIRTNQYPITIEGTTSSEISMFGTYRLQTSKKEKSLTKTDDFVTAKHVGDTLYVDVKALPEEIAPFDTFGTINATLLIPSDLSLEVIGSDNPITLKTRMLMSDWSVDQAASVSVYVQEQSNMKISAIGVQEIYGQEGVWKVSEGGKSEHDASVNHKNAIYQNGSGESQVKIMNTYSVSLNTP